MVDFLLSKQHRKVGLFHIGFHSVIEKIKQCVQDDLFFTECGPEHFFYENADPKNPVTYPELLFEISTSASEKIKSTHFASLCGEYEFFPEESLKKDKNSLKQPFFK